MPNDQQKPRLSNYEIEQRAGEANSILRHPVFISALEEVYSRAVGTLLGADVGSLTATQAHAMMKAINDLQAQLKQYEVDHELRNKYHKGDK